jgi:hypothetical protein
MVVHRGNSFRVPNLFLSFYNGCSPFHTLYLYSLHLSFLDIVWILCHWCWGYAGGQAANPLVIRFFVLCHRCIPIRPT